MDYKKLRDQYEREIVNALINKMKIRKCSKCKKEMIPQKDIGLSVAWSDKEEHYPVWYCNNCGTVCEMTPEEAIEFADDMQDKKEQEEFDRIDQDR
jgi:RNase P subunit RPR2